MCVQDETSVCPGGVLEKWGHHFFLGTSMAGQSLESRISSWNQAVCPRQDGAPESSPVPLGTHQAEGVKNGNVGYQVRNRKPANKAYQEADEGGCSWMCNLEEPQTFCLRYRMGGRGSRQEKVTLATIQGDRIYLA